MLFTAADAVFFCFWGSVFCPGKKVKAMKTPVSRVGNKTPILNILYAVFPIDYTRYIDVFGGSGSVLLGKPRIDPFEVYNDYDRNLANLFRCMKYRTMALIRELGFCTLNSRDDFHSMCQFLNNEPFVEPHMEEELELTEIMLPPVYAKQIKEMRQRISGDCDVRRAAMFLRTLRTSYSSQGTSFACQPFDIRKLFTLIQQTGDRLSEVIIENQDYQILIPHYDRPDSFFYCNPPYYSTEDMYAVEFRPDDHELLRKTLGNIRGKFLLSYNDCEEIRSLYEGFPMLDFTRTHSMAQRFQPGKEFKELLIANYDLYEREKAKPAQMALFDPHGNDLETGFLTDSEAYERILKECIIPCKIK